MDIIACFLVASQIRDEDVLLMGLLTPGQSLCAVFGVGIQ